MPFAPAEGVGFEGVPGAWQDLGTVVKCQTGPGVVFVPTDKPQLSLAMILQ